MRLYNSEKQLNSNNPRMTDNCDEIISTIKNFESQELFKVIKVIIAELEKKLKDNKTSKKNGSAPKGVVPPQLMKPRAWVEYTLKDAIENGWEPFNIRQKRKNKETGTMEEELIAMPGSCIQGDVNVYKDSITEKTPNGRQINHKDAMSLSKERKETGHKTYSTFEKQYGVEEVEVEEEVKVEVKTEVKEMKTEKSNKQIKKKVSK